jgi:hypothetical protein
MAHRRDLIIEEASPVPLPPPILVSGEDAAGYEQLAARITAALAPVDGEFALVPTDHDAAASGAPA